MRVFPPLIVAIGQLLVFAAHPVLAQALDGKTLVTERCVSCHDTTGPAPQTYQGVLDRKAPDLFYAGSKFNRAWLVDWLQNPTIIRRAGIMFLNHLADEGGEDKIVEETVKPCPSDLSRAQAEAAADHLMALKDPAMKAGVVEPAKKLRKHKAYRLFTKQLPCIGCHRIKFGKRTKGGISGPDLTKAGERLNPDWVYARIENPQYWDPKTWMPGIQMSHRKREMLTLFVSSMK
jgi:cbb3-type cytochrome oxidase cytochrome c subunit